MNLHHLFNLLVVFSQDLYLLVMAYGFGFAFTAGIMKTMKRWPMTIESNVKHYYLKEDK